MAFSKQTVLLQLGRPALSYSKEWIPKSPTERGEKALGHLVGMIWQQLLRRRLSWFGGLLACSHSFYLFTLKKDINSIFFRSFFESSEINHINFFSVLRTDGFPSPRLFLDRLGISSTFTFLLFQLSERKRQLILSLQLSLKDRGGRKDRRSESY